MNIDSVHFSYEVLYQETLKGGFSFLVIFKCIVHVLTTYMFYPSLN